MPPPSRGRLERAASSKRRADKYGIMLATSSAAHSGPAGPSSGAGGIVLDEGEVAWDVRQRDVLDAVPEQDRARMLELTLNFGPYKAAYTPSGRDLTLVGHNGHIACLNLRDATLRGETHLSQVCHDVTYLHDESLVAVAQQSATFIYTTTDTAELHCLTELPNMEHLTFLRQHYLLAAAGRQGRISWFDVSLGRRIASARTNRGPVTALTHNPQSGVVAAGSRGGVVTFWTPNCPQQAAVTLLAATAPVTHLGFYDDGNTFVTASADSVVRVWDVRSLRPMHAFSTGGAVSAMDISQRGTLAVGVGGRVTTFSKDALVRSGADPLLVSARRDGLTERVRAVATAADAAAVPAVASHGRGVGTAAQSGKGGVLSGAAAALAALPPPGAVEVGLRHALPSDTRISDLKFCPFTDVLGIAHRRGIAAMYVPGAAHAQLSAEGVNPYASSKERKDVAVRRLLDKLPVETIVWDPSAVGDAAGGSGAAAALKRHGESVRNKRLKAVVRKRKEERKRAMEAVGGGVVREGQEELARLKARANARHGDETDDSDAGASVRSESTHDSDWEAAKMSRSRSKARKGTTGHYVRQRLKDQNALRRKIRGRNEAVDAARAEGGGGDDGEEPKAKRLAAHSAVRAAEKVGVGAALGRFM